MLCCYGCWGMWCPVFANTSADIGENTSVQNLTRYSILIVQMQQNQQDILSKFRTPLRSISIKGGIVAAHSCVILTYSCARELVLSSISTATISASHGCTREMCHHAVTAIKEAYGIPIITWCLFMVSQGRNSKRLSAS